MARRRRKKTSEAQSDSTALLSLRKEDGIARSVRTRRQTVRMKMNAFLKAYEMSYGNVKTSTEAAGISARTYFRWKDTRSTASVYKMFRTKLERLIPIIARNMIDDAAQTVRAHTQLGNLTAAMFTLNTRGQDYGWNAKPPPPPPPPDPTELERAVKGFKYWLEDHPDDPRTILFLRRFAENFKVEPKVLAAHAGVNYTEPQRTDA